MESVLVVDLVNSSVGSDCVVCLLLGDVVVIVNVSREYLLTERAWKGTLIYITYMVAGGEESSALA